MNANTTIVSLKTEKTEQGYKITTIVHDVAVSDKEPLTNSFLVSEAIVSKYSKETGHTPESTDFNWTGFVAYLMKKAVGALSDPGYKN